jgi:hypothetical protein
MILTSQVLRDLQRKYKFSFRMTFKKRRFLFQCYTQTWMTRATWLCFFTSARCVEKWAKWWKYSELVTIPEMKKFNNWTITTEIKASRDETDNPTKHQTSTISCTRTPFIQHSQVLQIPKTLSNGTDNLSSLSVRSSVRPCFASKRKEHLFYIFSIATCSIVRN